MIKLKTRLPEPLVVFLFKERQMKNSKFFLNSLSSVVGFFLNFAQQNLLF